MLSVNDIAAWGRAHPWASADQIEQDLLLSRAICAIADDDYLGQELAFRGGTALHKLHLPAPLRYFRVRDFEHYLIYYIDLPTHVEVIRVWSTARGLDALMGNEE